MTTIVWDGKTLAADRLADMGNIKHAVCKIFRLKDGSLFGGSGDLESVLDVRQWLEGGTRPEWRNDTDWPACIVIEPGGTILRYERRLVAMRVLAAQTAIGSGSMFAMGALAMGATAERAVEIAIQLDTHTGLGIDTLTLEARS